MNERTKERTNGWMYGWMDFIGTEFRRLKTALVSKYTHIADVVRRVVFFCSCDVFRQYFAVRRVKCSTTVSPFCSNYQNNSTSSPGFQGQRFNNLQKGCTFDVILTSSVRYDDILCKFGQQQRVMVNYACSFNQSETGKYH